MNEEALSIANSSSQDSAHIAVYQHAVRALQAVQGIVEHNKGRLTPATICRNTSSNMHLQQLLDEGMHHLQQVVRLERAADEAVDQTTIYAMPSINDRLEDLVNENLSLKAELFETKRRLEISFCEMNDLVQDKLALTAEVDSQRDTIKKLRGKNAALSRSKNGRLSKQARAVAPAATSLSSSTQPISDNQTKTSRATNNSTSISTSGGQNHVTVRSAGSSANPSPFPSSHIEAISSLPSQWPSTDPSDTTTGDNASKTTTMVDLKSFQATNHSHSNNSSAASSNSSSSRVDHGRAFLAQKAGDSSSSSSSQSQSKSDLPLGKRMREAKVKYHPSYPSNQSEPSPASMKEIDPHQLIGRRIRKRFGALGFFEGLVVSYKKPFYRIRYDDEDREDLSMSQVLKHLISDSDTLSSHADAKRSRQSYPDHSLIDYSIAYHADTANADASFSQTAQEGKSQSPDADFSFTSLIEDLKSQPATKPREVIEIDDDDEDASDGDIESIDSQDFQVIANPNRGSTGSDQPVTSSAPPSSPFLATQASDHQLTENRPDDSSAMEGSIEQQHAEGEEEGGGVTEQSSTIESMDDYWASTNTINQLLSS
jgi:trimeric autotransporter adhesin